MAQRIMDKILYMSFHELYKEFPYFTILVSVITICFLVFISYKSGEKIGKMIYNMKN